MRKRGLRIVAISVDAPAVTREHAAKMGYTFTFLSDEKMEVIGRYDLLHAKGRTRTGDDIARPAEFLLDSSGVVRWVNLTGDYKVRLEPETLLKVLDGLERVGGMDWKPLFNGKDLTGWEHVGPGRFVVENDLLKTEGGMGLLWYTGEKIGDAVVRVVYRTEEKTSNSGVFTRIPEPPKEPWMPVHRGYEVQIDDAGDDYTRRSPSDS